MKRSGKIKWGNMWVGIIISFALAMLLYSSFRGGGTSLFEPKGRLVAYFENVNGLVKGAPVWLGGVEVGNVKSVKFVYLDESRRIRAEISVKKSVWAFITTNSKVKLGTIGLLGDKYVEIIPGSQDFPVVEPGTVIDVEAAVGLDAMMAKTPQMAGSIDTLLTNLKDISKRITEGKGTAGKIVSDTALYDNLVAALQQVTDVMSELKKNQKNILEKLSGTLDNTNELTTKIKNGEGSIGKLFNDDSLYNNLSHSTARFDSILNKINQGQGSMGALVNDMELYEEVKDLVTRMNNLIADIEKNPRKYFKFSVF